MNILYHHRTQGHGAEGVHITGIVKGFRKMGHEVILHSPPGVDPFKTAGSYLYGQQKSLIGNLWKGISRHSPQVLFELIEIAYNFFQSAALNRILKDQKISLIYERYAFFLWQTARLSKKYGIPLILEVNEIAGIKRARPLILRNLAQMIEKRVFNQAARIVTVSSFLKRKIMEMGISEEKIIVMPNGVDLEMFKVQTAAANVRKQYGLEDSLVLGFVGWIDPWDNLPGFLEVFHDLLKRQANLKLLLIGDVAGKGVNRSLVGEMVERLGLSGTVTHIPKVPRTEMPNYIAAMDICVIPDSNAFGSPVVLFEFMAMGKAVVAPSVAPVLDVITHGENGLVFQADNGPSMSGAIWDAVRDPALRHKLSSEARKSVEQKHNWESNSKEILRIYSELGPRMATR